jgi:hypothetical protein
MHSLDHSHVLQLDIQGTPQAWISLEQAALHVATGSVAWVDGDGPLATLRGGFNVASGCGSRSSTCTRSSRCTARRGSTCSTWYRRSAGPSCSVVTG